MTNVIEHPEEDLQTGLVHKKITHDYILDLYEEIASKKIDEEVISYEPPLATSEIKLKLGDRPQEAARDIKLH